MTKFDKVYRQIIKECKENSIAKESFSSDILGGAAAGAGISLAGTAWSGAPAIGAAVVGAIIGGGAGLVNWFTGKLEQKKQLDSGDLNKLNQYQQKIQNKTLTLQEQQELGKLCEKYGINK